MAPSRNAKSVELTNHDVFLRAVKDARVTKRSPAVKQELAAEEIAETSTVEARLNALSSEVDRLRKLVVKKRGKHAVRQSAKKRITWQDLKELFNQISMRFEELSKAYEADDEEEAEDDVKEEVVEDDEDEEEWQ